MASTAESVNDIRKEISSGVYSLSDIPRTDHPKSRSHVWSFGTSNLARLKCYRDYVNNICGAGANTERSGKTVLHKLSTSLKTNLRRSEIEFIARDMRPMHALASHGLAALLSIFTSIGAKAGYCSASVCQELLSDATTVSWKVTKVAKGLREVLSEHGRNIYY